MVFKGRRSRKSLLARERENATTLFHKRRPRSLSLSLFLFYLSLCYLSFAVLAETRETREKRTEKRPRNAEAWKKLDCPPLHPPTQCRRALPPYFAGPPRRFRRFSSCFRSHAISFAVFSPLLTLSLSFPLALSCSFSFGTTIFLSSRDRSLQAACRIKRDISEDARR